MLECITAHLSPYYYGDYHEISELDDTRRVDYNNVDNCVAGVKSNVGFEFERKLLLS